MADDRLIGHVSVREIRLQETGVRHRVRQALIQLELRRHAVRKPGQPEKQVHSRNLLKHEPGALRLRKQLRTVEHRGERVVKELRFG